MFHLALFSGEQFSTRFRAMFLGVFVVLSAATLAICLHLSSSNDAAMRKAANRELQLFSDRVIDEIREFEIGLNAVRGAILLSGAGNLDAGKMRVLGKSMDIDRAFPGAMGLGTADAQVTDAGSFFVPGRAGSPSHLEPEAYQKMFLPLLRRAIAEGGLRGQDAEELRVRIISGRSEDELSPASGGMVAGGERIFLAVLSLHQDSAGPGMAQNGRDAAGWAYAPFSARSLVEASGFDLSGISLRISERDTDFEKAELFSSMAPEAGFSAFRSESLAREINGRSWIFELDLTGEFAAGLGLPSVWMIGATGFLISLIGALLAGVGAQGRARSRQLFKTRMELESVVESSIDGIIGKRLDGVVMSWNHGAEKIFGYSAEEAVGRPIAELILPPDRRSEEELILRTVAEGESIERLETRRLKKDGSLVDVSVAVAPVRDRHGKVIGVSKTVRDITDQKRTELELIRLKNELELEVEKRTEELDQARRALKTVFDALPSVIGYWDRNLINQVANRAYHDWFGLDPESMAGKGMRELLGESMFESNLPYIEGVLEGAPQHFERDFVDKEGRTRHLFGHYLPDKVDGEVMGFFVIVHDVTELSEGRMQLARALGQNEALLRTINEHLFYSETDAEGRILEANENFCRIHGYEKHELLGQTHRKVSSGMHGEDYWRAMWAVIREGQGWHGVVCNHRKDGGEVWFDTVIAPVFSEPGVIARYIALRIDITDRKKAEEEVGRLNQFVSNVLGAASEVSIIATDEAGMITVFNSGAERMLGYRAEEMVSVSSPLCLHVEEEVRQRAERLYEIYGERLSGLDVMTHVPRHYGAQTLEWTYVRRNGSVLTVSLSVTAMHNEYGRLIGFLGIGIDVTSQREQQRDLAEAKDQLVLAAKTASLGVWTWNIARGVLEWDAKMLQIHGVGEGQVQQSIAYDFWMSRIHPEDRAETEAALRQALEKGQEFRPVYRILVGEEVRFIQAGAHIERDDRGRPVKAVGINIDVTERMLFLERLMDAKRVAEEASLAKGQFLANMSHEIRTPMNAVLGMLQLLQRTRLDARQRDFAEKARSAARSLLGLLNDVLDFSKIEAGKLQLDEHSFDLEETFADLAVILSGNVGEKDIEVVFDVDPHLPRAVIADSLRIQQVLINLAGNAVKFTSQGEVVVGVRVLRGDEGGHRLGFYVSDTGIGISPEQIEKIFEGFSQAEASTTRRFGGTGLGLAISKRLVELMGGTLSVSSQPGQGSRFSFDIPLHCPEPPGEVERATLPGLARQALVADDNALCARFVARVLEHSGWRVSIAQDGREALHRYEEGRRRGDPYELVILDWRMPEGDGLFVAEAIRGSAAASKPVIVMVTAFGRSVLSDVTDQGGHPFDAYLVKPVVPSQLMQLVAESFDPSLKRVADLGEPEHPARLGGARILVVEDNPLNRQVAQALLAEEGAVVTLAEDGVLGVEAFRQNQRGFDLVLMDMQMPRMDGLEASRQIRRTEETGRIPIIAMTANISPADRQACLAAGMDDHVGKPIDIVELLGVLGKYLKNLPGPQTEQTASDAEEAPASTADVLESHSGIMLRFNGNVALFRSLLETFPDECRKLVVSAREAAMAQDGKLFGLAVHSIKGATATVGAVRASRLAARLEDESRQEGGRLEAAGIAADLDELETLIDESYQRLVQMFPENAGFLPEDGTAPAAMEEEAWLAYLGGLRDKLQAGDASVLDDAAALRNAPVGVRAEANQLASLINDFRFAEAAGLVSKIEGKRG